jgi:hypothetical protein
MNSYAGENFSNAHTYRIGGEFQRHGGGGDLVDRVNVDLEAHDLHLEIVLVAVLGGDEEAVIGT